MIQPGYYTLVDIVEQYNIMQGNERRKNFDTYLIIAGNIWNDIFIETLLSYSMAALPVIRNRANKYPYIDLPANTEKFYGLYDTDDCGRLVHIEGTGLYDIVPRPERKQCGCTKNCGCGDASSGAQTLSIITKEHIISGQPYPEKIWQQVYDDGTILEHREYPAKEYYEVPSTSVFGPEFGPEFHDNTGTFRVKYVTSQRRVNKVEMLPCGCVAETPANKEILVNVGGVLCLPACVKDKPLKVQREGDRLYLIGTVKKEHYVAQIIEGCASASSKVPRNALMAMCSGIEYHSTKYHPRFRGQRHFKLQYKEDLNDMVMNLNKIDLDFVNNLSLKQRKL